MHGEFFRTQGKNTFLPRGFTLVELVIVIALIGMLFSIVATLLSDAQRSARDKRRISDVTQLQRALELYYTDHQAYPKESEGANGDTAANAVLKAALAPYLSGTPKDPFNNSTFFYYYDGKHRCGIKDYAVIFVRQVEDPANANYMALSDGSCAGIIDGEGRGGGTDSYNIFLDESSG